MVKYQESTVRSKPTFSTQNYQSKYGQHPQSAKENLVELLMDVLERVKGVIRCTLHGEVDLKHH